MFGLPRRYAEGRLGVAGVVKMLVDKIQKEESNYGAIATLITEEWLRRFKTSLMAAHNWQANGRVAICAIVGRI